MSDVSFDSPVATETPSAAGREPERKTRSLEIGKWPQVWMVLMGYVPALHLLSVAVCVTVPLAGYIPRPYAFLSLAMLYLVPPLVCRVAMAASSKPEGSFCLSSREFLAWWFQAQWQMIFNRFRFLEELLRMLPGVYSLWLRLWGARIGKFVYWSPGVAILDRAYLSVGDRVVFGAGVRINPHILTPDAGGAMTLIVAPVSVGAGSLIGGYSLLSPGVRVGEGETLPALYVTPPLLEWKDGRRVRPIRLAATTGE